MEHRPVDMPLNDDPGPVTPHLAALRLAALDQEPATPEELAHLGACAACRAERDAHGSLLALAADAGRFDANPDAPRLVPWDRLSASLRAEGLLTSTFDSTPARTRAQEPLVVRTLDGVEVPTRETPVPAPRAVGSMGSGSRFDLRRVLRAAAVVAAMTGSAAVGRATADGGAVGTRPAADVVAAAPGPDSATGVDGAPAAAGPGAGGNAVTVANLSAAPGGFASVDDATLTLMRAQQEYERAALWLAGNDTTVRSSEVYRARLAALDQMMAASRAALREAPQDPVLNHYFLAASTAREATLQQLSGALPVDKTIESY